MNPGPFTCKANALPLSYIPVTFTSLISTLFKISAYLPAAMGGPQEFDWYNRLPLDFTCRKNFYKQLKKHFSFISQKGRVCPININSNDVP